MAWFRIGPIVILVLFIANYFFMVHPRRKKAAPRQLNFSQKTTTFGSIVILLIMLFVFAGFAAPQVAPGSEFAELMSQDLAPLYLAIWAWLLLMVVAIIGHLAGFPLWENVASPKLPNPPHDK